MILLTDDIIQFCHCVGSFASKPINKVVIDSRIAQESDCFVCFKGNQNDGNDFIEEALRKRAFVIATDPIKVRRYTNYENVFYTKDPFKFLVKLAKHKRKQLACSVISLTGASGKTTTKEFLKQILQSKFRVFATPKNENNLLGVSLSLCNIPSNCQIAILETGTNHHGEVKQLTKLVRPSGSITTNIYPTHLEFFKNLEGVYSAETEQRLWFRNNPGFWCYNYDDKFLRRLRQIQLKAQLHSFSLRNRNADIFCESIEHKTNKKEFLYLVKINVFKKPLIFRHFGEFNIENLLGAISVAQNFMCVAEIENFLNFSSLSLPDFRSNVITRRNKIFIFDCYNANPVSFRKAIEETLKIKEKTFPKFKLVGVFADMLELGARSRYYHNKLASFVSKCGFSRVFYTGSYGTLFERCLRKKVFSFTNLKFVASSLATMKNIVVLVKGSHGFRLDKLKEYLK
ncbi:MAG: UDP-N-acetylmuramoyl-tripeptide--D-alanyl-D-alanine ligase [Deltaproteobacteria bacterium]|nr:UDP-N-acetylmuramoyl-tripeptide--D-alanyl-D-alanine ligase [Deltaproteobacteria bacterium]